jgi:hypothetical protein
MRATDIPRLLDGVYAKATALPRDVVLDTVNLLQLHTRAAAYEWHRETFNPPGHRNGRYSGSPSPPASPTPS